MQTAPAFTSPGSDQQGLRISYEDLLVATARYQRNPTEAHKALVERRKRWFAERGEVTDLDERGRTLAERIAAERLSDDDLVGRCLCGQCPSVPSASTERVPADHGRELPRAAAC